MSMSSSSRWGLRLTSDDDEDNLALLFEEIVDVPRQNREPKNKVPRIEKTQATNEEMVSL